MTNDEIRAQLIDTAKYVNLIRAELSTGLRIPVPSIEHD